VFDAEWLNVLKLPTRVILGIFLGAAILLGLHSAEFLDINELGSIWVPLLVVVLIFSGTLSLTGIGAYIIPQFETANKRRAVQQRINEKAAKMQRKKEEIKAEVLVRLEYLSCYELFHLADCLREGTQSIYTYMHSPQISLLHFKGILYTPDGKHHQDHYPFMISDFVWQELQRRKEDFLEKDEKCKAKREKWRS